MKYYRRKRYSEKKSKKRLLRVLFVLAAAGVITVSASALGNHLKEKVEEADRRLAALETGTETVGAEESPVHYTAELPTERVSVFAAGYAFGEDGDFSSLSEMKARFDTVSVSLTENGVLIYPSPALLALSRVPTDGTAWGEGAMTYDGLRSFVSSAKGEGLRVSGVLEASRVGGELVPSVDLALLRELSGLGFDEVIVTGLSEMTAEVFTYLTELAEKGDVTVGAVFPAEEYSDAAKEKQFRMLSAAGVVLCADLNADRFPLEEADENVRRLCAELGGVIGTHGMRIFLDSSDEDYIRAEYHALRGYGIGNIQITKAISYAVLAENDAMREEETEKETVEPNPYASTGANQSPAKETEGETTAADGSDPGWF